MKSLYEQLAEYGHSDFYPLHMPGHKRNMPQMPMESFYGMDITEIEGFDNLHKPEGVLKEAMQKAARVFGAEETFFLVNGSTGGILSALSAVFQRGDSLLLARNSHKAAYHGIYLNGLLPIYLHPQIIEAFHLAGGIAVSQVEQKLRQCGDIRGVFLTSPTYDGVVSDVEEIVRLCHAQGIPVIVDEAHGAHFPFSERFPESALKAGADLVIHSIHKTLPAFTQTALLHVQGNLVDRERLRRFLKIYQTSSPSYLLMAGIEQCVMIMEREGEALCKAFFQNREWFLKELDSLSGLRIFCPQKAGKENRVRWGMKDMDSGKLIISTAGTSLSGKELYQRLQKDYHLQPEMAAYDYVTAIMTVQDKEEGWHRLAEALKEIDADLQRQKPAERVPDNAPEAKPEKESLFDSGRWMNNDMLRALPLWQAMDAPQEEIDLKSGAGRVAGEFINAYPPGIPLIVPGEVYTEELLEHIRQLHGQGLTIEGLFAGGRTIKVLKTDMVRNCNLG